MIKTRIVSILFFALIQMCAITAAYSQGAHYTYPFTVQCSEQPVRAGEKVVVTAVIPAGDEKYEKKWSWTVSAGTIVSGQGSRSITIDTTGQGNTSIVVRVERDLGVRTWEGVAKSADCLIPMLPEPVLIDEFGTAGVTCEETFARLDVFFTELGNNPNDQGYLVIYQTPDSRSAGHGRRQQVMNHLKMRRFDPSRLTVVLGPVRTGAKVQFWRVPAGTENPVLLEENASFTRSESKPEPDDSPFIFASKYIDGVPGCNGRLFDLEEYAEFLKKNDDLSGNIVIGETSLAAFRRTEREMRAELEGLGVAKSRIKTFFKKVKRNAAMQYKEIWIVPKKTRP